MRKALQAPAHTRVEMLKPLSAIQSYGLAVIAVSTALVGALLLQRYNFSGAEFTIFLAAIAITVV